MNRFKDLSDAIAILVERRKEAFGVDSVAWEILCHASQHVERQLRAYLTGGE